jgi:hypothetical protein
MVHQANHMKNILESNYKEFRTMQIFSVGVPIGICQGYPHIFIIVPTCSFFFVIQRKKLYNMISLRNDGNSFIYLKKLLNINIYSKSLY